MARFREHPYDYTMVLSVAPGRQLQPACLDFAANHVDHYWVDRSVFKERYTNEGLSQWIPPFRPVPHMARHALRESCSTAHFRVTMARLHGYVRRFADTGLLPHPRSGAC